MLYSTMILNLQYYRTDFDWTFWLRDETIFYSQAVLLKQKATSPSAGLQDSSK